MTVTSAAASGASLLSSLGLGGSSAASSTAAASTASPALNEQDFLSLMTTQLQDQDPLNPISNSEFFSQIAQFSTVSGINQLNSSFTSLGSQLTASQSTQAASLIGHSVLVPSSQAQLTSTGLSGAVEASGSGDVVVQVRNAAGALVSTIDLGQQSSGRIPFSWNGKDASGTAQPAGIYAISAQVVNGSTSQAATTDVTAQVQSVSLGSNGLTLNLLGGTSVAYSSVLQVS